MMQSNITDYISPDSCNSLSGLFLSRAARNPHGIAYRHFNRSSGQWQDSTWQEMVRTVCSWRQAMQSEAIPRGDRVAVMLASGPDWVAFEQAALSLGLIVVPLYANDRPENIAYILGSTESRILLCSSDHYLQHLAPAIDGLNCLTRILTTGHCLSEDKSTKVRSLSNWLPKLVEDFGAYTPTTTDTASIVFTSGTTGPPKGVMLSHRNILDNCHCSLQCMEIYPEDSFLSFLPLSHMLERTAGYYLPMMAGATVVFARSIPDLGEDLLTVKPTILVAVPRIFERIFSGITAKLAAGSAATATLFNFAVKIGWQVFLHQQGRGPWTPSMLVQPLLDRLVARKVRQKFGGRLRVIISGGAPLSAEIAKLFIGLGLPIYQGYGLTETSPVISVNRKDDNRPEGVGKPLPGQEVRIDINDELLVRGNCVMQGYWQNEEATARTIDKDGWLHTGDKATLIDGHIRIVGRLKEIIVLSNGEKVAPSDMEMAISMDPLFEHCLVLGEGRPFLTLLTVLNRQLWEEFARDQGVSPDLASLSLPKVRTAILHRIEPLLARFPGFVFIKDVALSLQPWTIDDGLLTPTLKLKRGAVEKHMAREIERMYKR